jgi:hypothetical protein
VDQIIEVLGAVEKLVGLHALRNLQGDGAKGVGDLARTRLHGVYLGYYFKGISKNPICWLSDVVFSAIPGVLAILDVPQCEVCENDGVVGQVDPLARLQLDAGETLGLDDVLVGRPCVYAVHSINAGPARLVTPGAWWRSPPT